MPDPARLLRHLTMTRWHLARAFPRAVLDAIEQAIARAETGHGGEIRFVIERELGMRELLRDLPPRERAARLFGELGVWDTERNNGVLIYVLLADHAVEILADRGFAGRVTEDEWRAVCGDIERAYAAGDFERGSVAGIEAVSRLIARHFPAADRNELDNRPLVL